MWRSEYSKQLNDSRIAILSSRDEAIHSILTEAKGQLVGLSKNKSKYKGLLTDLIAQVGQLHSLHSLAGSALACTLLDAFRSRSSTCPGPFLFRLVGACLLLMST